MSSAKCLHVTAYDESMGHTVCIHCGEVLEENAIVSEVAFAEKSSGAAVAEGFSISKDSARVKSFGKFSNFQVSRERVIENGNKKISLIANQMRMSQRQIEAAQRYFSLCVNHGFNKGRKSNTVCAACLYIVCRQDKTSHMLIDFADVLQINVYVLGAAFLRLVQILHQSLPLVDPALYIARFAARLEFGDQTQKVISDSLRLVQRMSRDWMQIGRRPAGICAASLFIASRMNGFERSFKEIILVVKICEATLKRRLDEFKATPSASLSVADFGNVWLEQDMDPPAFLEKSRIDETQETTESVASDEDFIAEMKEYLAGLDTDSVRTLLNSPVASPLITSAEKAFGGDDADLSALDNDPEVSGAVLTSTESDFKRFVWEDEFDLYMKESESRLKKKPPTDPSKKKKRKVERERLVGKDMQESVGNLINSKPALSKKINYEMLESIFE